MTKNFVLAVVLLGDLLLCPLEQVAHLLVAEVLAVLGEVAGDDDHVGRLLDHDLEGAVQDVGALAEHLAVGVLGDLVRGVLRDEVGREVVHVAHDGERELLGVRGGRVGSARGGGQRARGGRGSAGGDDELQEAAPVEGEGCVRGGLDF